MRCVNVFSTKEGLARGFGISPAMALMGYQPRRPTDFLHKDLNVDDRFVRDSGLPELFEQHQELLDRHRQAMFDRHLHQSQDVATQMDKLCQDLPPEWGKTRQTWYVYIKSEGFTRADTNQSGTRGKLAHEPAVGAYRVTWISADGSNFGVELPHWMRARYANKFNVKHIRKLVQEVTEPFGRLDAAINEANTGLAPPPDDNSDMWCDLDGRPRAELVALAKLNRLDARLSSSNLISKLRSIPTDSRKTTAVVNGPDTADTTSDEEQPPADVVQPGEYAVASILDRIYHRAQRCYKYKVRWEGYGASDDSYVPAQNLSCQSLLAKFNEEHPLGCYKTDSGFPIQSRIASLVASLRVLLPLLAGMTVAPNIFIRATLGAWRLISTSPIKTMHSKFIKAQTVAVATPCCPAPVSAMMRFLPKCLASKICPMVLFILCAPVWHKSSRFK